MSNSGASSRRFRRQILAATLVAGFGFAGVDEAATVSPGDSVIDDSSIINFSAQPGETCVKR